MLIVLPAVGLNTDRVLALGLQPAVVAVTQVSPCASSLP